MKGNIICLDHCAWIELSEIYHKGADTAEKKRLIDDVKKYYENGVFFPLTYERYYETVKTPDEEKRIQLAEFMIMLSRGLSFGPPGAGLIKKECHNLTVEQFRLPNNKYIFPETLKGFGLEGILGMKYKWTPINGVDREPTDEEKEKMKKFEEFVYSPEFLIKAFSDTIDETISTKDLVENNSKLFHSFAKESEENVKKDYDMIKNTGISWEQYRNDKQSQFFKDIILPIIEELLIKLNVDVNLLTPDEGKKKSWDEFYLQLPSVYTILTLIDERDRIRKKIGDPNDFNDVSFLSYCIPYGSIVITDKKWADICRYKKLDSIFQTKIMSVSEMLNNSIIL